MKKELTGRTYVRPKVEKSIVIGRPLLQTVSGNAGVIGSVFIVVYKMLALAAA